MIEAYKVGVTLALNNLVSAELLKMADLFATIDKAALSLNATLKGLAVPAEELGAGLGLAAKNMEAINVSAAAAAGNIGRLNAAGAGAGARGGLGGLKHQVEAFGIYEALKGGMSMDDTIARAMVAMGVPVGPNYMASPLAGGIRSSIFDTSTRFGVSQGDTQDAALQAMRALAPLSAEQRMQLLPSLMNFAGAEVLGKHGTTMQEATEAGIGLAHQMRAYRPEEIEPLLGAFAKLSMASPQSLSQMSRASSYYLPLLTAGLGMDPTELMALGTVGSQMGLNTKSGTWLSAMFQAPFVADLTSKRGSSRRKALEALGLVDESGKPVTRDAFEFLDIMAAHSQGMAPQERMKDFVAAFGQQGARAAAIFTDPAAMGNIHGIAQGLKGAAGPEALRQQYGNSPMVQFHQATSEFMKVLTQLGEQVMPQVTSGLKVFTDLLKAISGIINGVNWAADHAAGAVNSGIHSLFGSAVPPPQQQSAVVIQHQTKLDGRTLAESTTHYQVDGMAQASPSSGNDYDLRMTPMGAGFSAARGY